MNRRFASRVVLLVFALVVPALVAPAVALAADARVEQNTKMKIGGPIGALANVFMGKAAKEGLDSVQSLKGERLLSRTGDTGELIDLAQEKVWQINFKKETYTVRTFAEIRKKMEEDAERAKEQAKKNEGKKKEGVEMEIDLDVRETGKKQSISGYDTHEVVLTATVHERGKKVEETGGYLMTMDMWLGPRIKEIDEIAQFHMRYAEKLGILTAAQGRDIAAALAAYPEMQKALKQMQDRKVNMNGSAVRTDLAFEIVAGTQAAAGQAPSGGAKADDESTPTSIGGLFGKLGKKIAKKHDDEGGAAAGHTELVTGTILLTKVASSVAADDVAVPAGFKQKD